MSDLAPLSMAEARHDRAESAHNGRLAKADAISVHASAGPWAYYAGIGLLSALMAVAAFVTGPSWLIAVAGFSCALLGFTHGIANRYRARME